MQEHKSHKNWNNYIILCSSNSKWCVITCVFISINEDGYKIIFWNFPQDLACQNKQTNVVYGWKWIWMNVFHHQWRVNAWWFINFVNCG
jgi:hypothetical protein